MEQQTQPQDNKINSNPKEKKKKIKHPKRHHEINYLLYSSSVFFTSTAIALLNFYNIFAVLFWLSSDQLPTEIYLMIEIIIEFLLICEISIRIAYKLCLKPLYNDIKLYHKKQDDTLLYLVMIWIASFPQQILFSIITKGSPTSDVSNYSYFLVIKLLRCIPEVNRYTAKLEELLFYKTTKTLIFMKCVQNIGLIILITHFASSVFLLIQKLHPNIDYTPYQRPFNPYGSDTSYFARKNLTNAPLPDKYVDALYWAVSTMTACSFGDVTPRSYAEIIASIFILVIGASVLAKVFADFASLNYLLNLEKTITANKFEQAQKFCKINKIPRDIFNKILDYFRIDPEIGDPVTKHYLTHSLPQSLQSELSISLNKDFIEKSNLFNFSSPEFIISLCKKLSPMVSMQGDYICRVGEIAEEMYFIQTGEVEVYATDGMTKLAVLKEGAFFGEIGLMLTRKRTTFVKAKSLCVLQVLKKEDFDELHEVFHSEFNYLKKVASQRNLICHPEDLILARTGHKSRISFHSKLEKALSKGIEKFKTTDEIQSKPTLNSMASEKLGNIWSNVNHLIKVERDKDSIWNHLMCKVVIMPQSLFYRLWTALMILALVYNLIYIPYSISFEYQANEGDLLPVDLISIVLYALDILIQANTARPKGSDFVVDLISVIPFDYIIENLNLANEYSSWIRVSLFKFLEHKLFRLVKLKKIVMMLNIIKKENIIGTGRLGSLIVAFLFLNHWYACILYLLARADHSDNPNYNLFTYADTVTKDKIPLWDQEHYLKYFAFVYWALQISTGGSSMDVLPITMYEKIVQCIGLLFFKVYFAFVGAEVTSIVIAMKIAFTENADKNEAYNKWMENMKLDHKLQERVRNFNKLKWDKFKGIDENQILANLPPTLGDEIREFMLRDMIEHIDIFSSVDSGFVSSFIKRLRFYILCEGEFVFKKGDIAEDIFFIFEGNVAVMDLEDKNPIVTLKKSDMFGEMGVVQLSAGTRSRSIKAVTNVSLAVMSQDDLRDICKQFPEVQAKILEKIEDRKLQNQKKDKPKEEPKEEPKDQPKSEVTSPVTPIDPNNKIKELKKEPSVESDKGKNFKVEFKENKLEESSANLLQESSILTDEKTLDDDNRGTLIPEDNKSILNGTQLKIDPKTNLFTTDTSVDKILPVKSTPSFLNKILPEGVLKSRMENSSSNTNNETKKDAPKKGDSVTSDSSKNSQDPKNSTSETALSPHRDSNITRKQTSTEKKKQRTVMLIKFISGLGKKKAVKKFVGLFMRTRGFTLSLVSLYNITFLPLYLGLQTIQFKGVFLALEIISIIFYGFDAIIKLIRYFVEDFYREEIDEEKLQDLTIEELKQGRRQKSKIWFILGLIVSILYAVPFAMIFEYQHAHSRFLNIGMVLLQLIRLLGFDQLLWVFSLPFFKVRIALANILTSVLLFTLFNHFAGCIHMLVGYIIAHHDIEETWLTKLPAPQFEWPKNEIHLVTDSATLYISSMYWSYVTTMNLGVGDIISVGLYEKIWCAIIMIIAAFLFVFLFGNLVSLVDDIVPHYQKHYEEEFKHVLEYTKAKEYEKFSEKINKYYDYIWVSNKGFEEISLLKELPNTLKTEIQMDRYAQTINKSELFRDKEGQIMNSIVRYFFKKCEYLIAMTDDIIINEGQETEDVYFILEGDVTGYDHEADSLIRLKVGGYFGGYIPTFVQFYEYKASTITKLAIMRGKNFKFLCEAYPDWIDRVRMMNKSYRAVIGLQRKIKEYLQKKKEERTNPTRKQSEASTLFRQKSAVTGDNKSPEKLPTVTENGNDRKILVPTQNSSAVRSRDSTKRSKTMKFFSVLFNKETRNILKTRKFFIKPVSKLRIIIEAVHFVLIVYSVFAIPVIVGFELNLNGFSLVMEYLVLAEAIFYSLAQFRIGSYEAGILSVDFKTIFKSYLKRGLVAEMIAIIPFNLIFHWSGTHNPIGLISLLKLNRLVQLNRIPVIVGFFCSVNPKIMKYLALGKPIFLLTFIWHFTSVFWMWVNLVEKENLTEDYWLGSLELDRKSLFQQYIYCLHFLMNIATTTGYPEQIAYNNNERIVYIIFVNVGIGLFALAFGMMVESSKALPEKYQEIFELVCQLENMLAKRNVADLKKKLELYYSYIVENDTKSLSNFEELEFLPPNLLRDFTHEQSKFIMHHPMFEGIESRSFYIELFSLIEHQLFMPGDYIIQKGDYGLGIYFLVSGSILCYSSNERVVLLNLNEGDWFGEKSLLMLTKTTQTFVAETFCTLFFISKIHFEKILSQFPQISATITTRLQERIEILKADEKVMKNLNLTSHTKIKSLRSSDERGDFEKILLAMEVPVIEDDETKSPRSRVKKVSDALNLKKIQLLNGPTMDITQYDCVDDERIDDEFVAEDEFNELNDNFKKISLRSNGQEHMRRFSRIIIGSEKSLSKIGGSKIKWGINLN